MLHVAIDGIAGRTAELDIESTSSVEVLKSRVEGLWQIPPECQIIICGTEVLEDTQIMGTYCEDEGASLKLSLIVSLAEIYEQLRSPDVHVRVASLEVLRQMAPKTGDNYTALSAVSAALEDSQELVRQKAVESIAQFAKPGDTSSIDEIMLRLEHPNMCVRHAAVQALTRVVGRGNLYAIETASARLEHPSVGVRHAALEALAQISLKNDQQTITMVSKRLEHPDPHVQVAAAEALTLVTDRKRWSTLGALKRFLEHPLMRVRLQAAQSLARIGGYASIAARLGKQLKHKDAASRGEAVLTLALIAKDGSTDAIQAAIDCLPHPDVEVSKAALRILAIVVQKADEQTLQTVLQHMHLESEDPEIRKAVTEGFAACDVRADRR
eukprot:TRINITY_DN57215_c0_g1_i1.p1 TRINITY_DN57215_c0_g1~~TRINITY_DN57215_c0_g1_i1.p1  ORF type:complete len:383 (-),score=59.42 TRINITY_DN57215_c0_g1_i1:496-1644(-)